MPSPRVQWREPLHDFWVLIGYDFVDIDGIVVFRYVLDDIVTSRYVIAVDITVAHRYRARI